MGQGIVGDRIQAYIGVLRPAKSMTHAGRKEPYAYRTRLYMFCINAYMFSAGFSFLRMIHAMQGQLARLKDGMLGYFLFPTKDDDEFGKNVYCAGSPLGLVVRLESDLMPHDSVHALIPNGNTGPFCFSFQDSQDFK